MTVGNPACRDETSGPWAGPDCRGGFDFTLFFEESVLSIPIDAIFLLATAAVVLRQYPESVKLEQNTSSRVRSIGKLGAAVCLISIRLTLLVLWADSDGDMALTKTRASVPAAALSFIAALAYLFFTWFEHSRSVRPSFELEMYLFFATLLNTARARTLWLLDLNSATVPAVFTTSMVIQAVGLLFESWEKRPALREPWSKWAAESLGGTFNRSFFFWLNSLLFLGSRQLLTLSDLPPLDTKLDPERLQSELQEAWDSVTDKTGSGALLSTWLSAHKRMILAGAIPKLCQIAFVFTQPLLVERAIAFAATPSTREHNNVGYGLIGAYVLVYFGIAISTGQHQWRMARATSYMRSAIVPCITRKTLRIDLAHTHSASALTLITTDIETIDGGVMLIHELWGSLIEIGVGAYLLWRQIHSAMGIPLGVVFFVLIIATCMAVPIGTKLAAWIKASEERVAATSRILGNVKSYRIAGLNSIAFEAIEKLRHHEIQISRKFRLWFGAATILPLCLPSLSPALSFAGFVGLSSDSGGLSISQALTSLSILALLNRPLAKFSIALPSIAGAVASFDRIQEYLNVSEREEKRTYARRASSVNIGEKRKAGNQVDDLMQDSVGGSTTGADETSRSDNTVSDEDIPLPKGIAVTVSASMKWPESDKAVLDIHNLKMPAGAITAVLGPTGCGKTTLLNIIMGELTAFEGTVRISSLDISYCAQKTWLPRGPIRDAILGGMEYDEELYARIIRACALTKDFAALPAGDKSLLGNKGTSLSGGQKQRIAIARAVYARRCLCILDDAFKGLDNTTSETVMNNLLGPYGLLRATGLTTLISASNSSIVRFSDYLVTMNQNGMIDYQGSPQGSGFLSMSESTQILEGTEPITTLRDEKSQDTTQPTIVPSQAQESTPTTSQAMLEELDMTRQVGDTSVHKYYIKAAGVKSTLIFLSALVLVAFSESFSQIWLLWWTEDVEKSPNSSTGRWLGVYAAFGVLGVLGNMLAAWEIFIVVITKTGIHFHSMLVKTVSRVPMSFFNTVDQGVTVNRFSQDMQLIDMELPACVLAAATAIASVVGQAVIIGVTARYIAIAFPFILFIFYLIQKFYLRTSRQMRFLDIEYKAPLYSQTIETLDGLASIRAFRFEASVMDTMCRSLTDSQRPVYFLSCLQQWLQFTGDMTVAVMAILLIVITTTLREQIGVGFMGLALTNVVAFGSTVQMLLVTWVQLEISLGAVARVKRFTSSIEPETHDQPATGSGPGEDWPSRGRIVFSNVSASYPSTGRVLHDISLEIPAGSKVGVCGRTGSGKSSLALTLFKLVDLDEGSILIDDVDIATVSHDSLRDAIVGVPQDFLTLDETLRLNIDPHSTKTDPELIIILEKIQLWEACKPRGGLDMAIHENTLSYGELQLLAFARAMCRNSKILILDEASSSMDDENSSIISDLTRTWFNDWTIVSVAHKLESIREFDKVLMLDSGRIVEFESPDKLLNDPSSQFKKLYNS